MAKAKEEVLEVEIVEELTLRPLKTKDIFSLSRVIRAMNLKFNFTPDMTQSQVGMEIMTSVIGNLGDAEDEVSAFIASLAGITAEEFEELDIDVSVRLLTQFKDMKGISGFFSSASKLTKQ